MRHESDDGQTWTRVATDAPNAVRRLVMDGNLDEDLYMMGGGRHDDTEPVAFNGLYAFDGTT